MLLPSPTWVQANRYWHDVASAADTCVGGGSRTLIIADKNLVPSPPGNMQRALGTVAESGEHASVEGYSELFCLRQSKLFCLRQSELFCLV